MKNGNTNSGSAGHLHESVRPYLHMSDNDRITFIESRRWIGYPRAVQILDQMEHLLRYPKNHRMPNLLVVGRTNNGKTVIVNKFAANHPADENEQGNGVSVPVLSFRMPPVPNVMQFYERILRTLAAPLKNSDRLARRERQVFDLLARINLKMVIIDDIHNVLRGRLDKQLEFLSTLRDFGNELQVPIVAVGTKDAFMAVQSDPQLANRFEPVILPLWDVGDDSRRLLASFEMLLPLKKPSNLSETSMSIKILSMSEGTIGDTSMLLNRAAIFAIKSGTEQITEKVLENVVWNSPSKRKEMAKETI